MTVGQTEPGLNGQSISQPVVMYVGLAAALGSVELQTASGLESQDDRGWLSHLLRVFSANRHLLST